MRKSTATIVSILLPCAAYLGVTILTERMCWDTTSPDGKERRAAVATRDNVTPFQKWGFKNYIQPYLDGYYEAAWHFT
jgi:hypothetical protein